MNLHVYFPLIAAVFHTNLLISGTILPESKTVVVGDTAEFHCQVDDHGTLKNIDWVFTWAGDNVGLYIAAETTGIVGPSTSAFLKDDHGIYRTFYERIETDFGHIHNCTLRIDKVKKGDEGRYNCAYYRRSRSGDFYEHITTNSAQLRVLLPPADGSPVCDFLTTTSDLRNLDRPWKEAFAKLNCESTGGDPPAMLKWFSNGEEVSSGEERLNSEEFQLTHEDNGREFVCVATSPALRESRNCSVIPFRIPLSVNLKKSEEVLSVGQSIRFVCRGHGLPKIDGYLWFVNELRIMADTHERYTVETTENESVLTIFGIKKTENRTNVTCQVNNPHGLSATASAEIRVVQSNSMSSPAQLMPFILGSIVGLLIIILIATLSVIVYKHKRKPERRLQDNDFQESLSNDYEHIRSSVCKYEVQYVGSDTSNKEAIYANQTTRGTGEKVSLLTTSTSYEVVEPKRVKKTQKPTLNVEGLEYADLDLPSPVDDNVILNPGADEVVTYSQFTSAC